jgi:hypothetical protein
MLHIKFTTACILTLMSEARISYKGKTATKINKA